MSDLGPSPRTFASRLLARADSAGFAAPAFNYSEHLGLPRHRRRR
jgi:hypothetical protein